MIVCIPQKRNDPSFVTLITTSGSACDSGKFLLSAPDPNPHGI